MSGYRKFLCNVFLFLNHREIKLRQLLKFSPKVTEIDFKDLARRNPIIGTGLAILMLSLAGIPPYENRIGIQFYYLYFIYAIVFTALDVLAVFLYSWAVSGDAFVFSALALIPLGVFVSFLVLAFGYTAYRTKDWKKNVL